MTRYLPDKWGVFYGKRIAAEVYSSEPTSYTISDRFVSRIAARNSPLIRVTSRGAAGRL